MRASPFLALAALALAGCAKVPKNAGSQFTHLLFTFTLAAPVSSDPNYVYAIAIRPLTTTDPTTDSLGPIPVITLGTRSGIVAGRPTRLIEYTPNTGSVPYTVNSFVGASSDPSDPDPGTPTQIGVPISGSDPTSGGNPNQISFEITLRDLADTDDAARAIMAFQFNILTMNEVYTPNPLVPRVIDALGDQRSTTTFNDYRTVIVTTSGTYSSTGTGGGQSSSTPEQSGDTYPPGYNLPTVDIVDWSVQVLPQS